jgi:hypothetical protein
MNTSIVSESANWPLIMEREITSFLLHLRVVLKALLVWLSMEEELVHNCILLEAMIACRERCK